MEETSIASRLKSLIEQLGLSDSQFADRCSISRPTLSLLLAGKNKKISDVQLAQIHSAFPEVSILWILFGEGSMFNSNEIKYENENSVNENRIFQDNTTADEEQLNLVNVKQLENIIQSVINKSFDSSYIDLEKLILKSTEKLLPRKVSSVTVYYDDSTFETFIPKNPILA